MYSGETEALTEAARQFFKAELDYKTLNSPTFDENLNASINCYAHAVRIHIENRQVIICGRAGILSWSDH